MPRINLLPWRDQQRRERKLALYVWLLFALIGAALVTGAGYLWMSSMIDAQTARNDRLKAEIRVLDRQNEEINDLESQKQRFISRMQVIDKLQRSRSEIVHVFDEIAKIVPDGTYLTAVTQTSRKLKLEGVAQSSTRVSSFMRAIAGSQWLRNPELEVVEARKESTLGNSFVLHAEQNPLPGDDESAPAAAPPAKKGKRTASAGGAK
ncbi:MAG: PilN domain-containing protein [Chloroflexi bacterium]|nr:PilN domain-containing protein [Chloroflexota bacterium]